MKKIGYYSMDEYLLLLNKFCDGALGFVMELNRKERLVIHFRLSDKMLWKPPLK